MARNIYTPPENYSSLCSTGCLPPAPLAVRTAIILLLNRVACEGRCVHRPQLTILRTRPGYVAIGAPVSFLN